MVKMCNKRKLETEFVKFYGSMSKNYEGNVEKCIEGNWGKAFAK